MVLTMKPILSVGMTHRSEIQDRLGLELEIRLNKDGMKLPETRPASEYLARVAEFIFKKGCLQPTNLPIKIGSGRHLVNSEPKQRASVEMFCPKIASQSVHLGTNYNKDGIRRKTENLTRLYSDG